MYQIIARIPSGNRFIYLKIRGGGSDPSAISLLKIPLESFPSARTLSKLKAEYFILQEVKHPSIAQVISIEQYESSIALAMKDIPGDPVSMIIQNKPLAMADFFSIAIQLAELVSYLHSQQVMHAEICPANVWFDRYTGKITLCGFSQAMKFARQAVPVDASALADLPIKYISPEQTARINQAVDYRTDLYSLGVLLYKMITGNTPFSSDDPMEIIHGHIARVPVEPALLNREVSTSLSGVIMRLLEKDKEKRYQSAIGLLADLNRCLDQYENHKTITEFEIGTDDVSSQFSIPDRLYGRVNELGLLNELYTKAATGNQESILITGYSGIGKSRLVQELRSEVQHRGGHFVSGKFDQYNRDVPLSSLLNALSEWFRYILAGNEDELSKWKIKISDAVGLNGRLIVDAIPEVGLLIGAQPDVAELPPLESNNRFNSVFQSFFSALTGPEYPLCLFLDDIQWIDSSTRLWIENMMLTRPFNYLLFVGAYRDNEVLPDHPLALMFERLRNKKVGISELQLAPLNKETLNQIVSDSLKRLPEDCMALSDLIYSKTNGNPFFSIQSILTLADLHHITFNSENRRWEFDLEAASEIDTSDNVVDMMVGLINSLEPKAQTLLQVASTIGNEFSVDLLNKVCFNDDDQTENYLKTALLKGLIVPVFLREENVYRFLHDRIRQAAFSMLKSEDMKSYRLKLGRILLKEIEVSPAEPKIYEVADHLNFAADRIDDHMERRRLSEINLTASIRSKNATAYDSSLRYVVQAMEIFTEKADDASAVLLNALLLQRAEAEHLCGNNDIAEEYFDRVIARTYDVLDKARIYHRKIHYYTNLRKFNEAYITGREAVKMLGVSIPASFVPPLFLKELALYKILSAGKSPDDVLRMREMTNEKLKMAILLMATFARAAYQIKPELCVVLCTKMVNICLKHGNTDGGFIGYLALGPIFFGAILNQKQTGFDLGKLTLSLVEKYKSVLYKAETHFVVGYFAIPWRRPAQEMEQYWQEAYEAGLAAGDFFHTSCACCGTIQSMLMRGAPFSEIRALLNRYMEFLVRVDNNETMLTLQFIDQCMLNLEGKTISGESFSSDNFDEVEHVAILSNLSSRHFAHYYFINKMLSLYLWGHYEQAFEFSGKSDGYLKDSPGMMHTAEHFFLKGLIICALAGTNNSSKKIHWRREMRSILKKFTKYSKGCENNFVHKEKLLEAECLLLDGNFSGAESAYYQAIELSSRYGYMQIYALANEKLGKLLHRLGRQRTAGVHMKDAEYAYRRWGADAYASHLVDQNPWITSDDRMVNIVSTSGSESLNSASLDLSTLIKSSEAISREIRLRDLMDSMLRIIMENAGAGRLVLLLSGVSGLIVKASLRAEENTEFLNDLKLDEFEGISRSVVNYVVNSFQPVVLDNALEKSSYANDPYFIVNKIKSVLCAPLIQQGKLTGVVYLENDLTHGAFTQERIEMLNLLSGQMAISLENAMLYENLEEKVAERTRQLNDEKNRSEALLLNILPAETAEELLRTGSATARDFANATVLFTDFKNFTSISENLSAQKLVSEINFCYSMFDKILEKYGIEKIKTIGDSYMCASGLPVESISGAEDMVNAAIEIRDFMVSERGKRADVGENFFEIRIGMHTGPVVAGIVGIKKFAYDIWGDTVNIASRMESSSEPGKINISGSTYEVVKDHFKCHYRGKIMAKNKGEVDMYFVEGLSQE